MVWYDGGGVLEGLKKNDTVFERSLTLRNWLKDIYYADI